MSSSGIDNPALCQDVLACKNGALLPLATLNPKPSSKKST